MADPLDKTSTGNEIELVVIGCSRGSLCGKTQLCRRFVKEAYIENDRIPTVSETYTSTFKQGEEIFTVKIWDTSGNEIYDRLNKLFIQVADVDIYFLQGYSWCLEGHSQYEWVRGDTSGMDNFDYLTGYIIYNTDINGLMVVYDITLGHALENAEVTLALYDETITLKNPAMMVIGNKCDLEGERKLSTLSGYQLKRETAATTFEYYVQVRFNKWSKVTLMSDTELAKKHGAMFFEVSAKTNANVEKAFHTLCRAAIAKKYEKKNTVPVEIWQDPYALHLYEKSLEEGREKDKSIRVNIVGNCRQGKTTLLRRLVGHKIKGITSTDGISIEQYKCKDTKKGKYIRTGDIDQSEYVKRLFSSIKTIKGEDIEGTKQQTQYLKESEVLQEKKPKVTEVSPIHEGAADQHDNLKTETKSASSNGYEEIDNKLDKISILSPKEKTKIVRALMTNLALPQEERQAVLDIWDFGGQYIFYATHTIFHSRRAIYLLVFDLSLDLQQCITDERYPTESEDRNMEYFIQFWMNSIHSFVGSADGTLPKVILVGTHKDKLKGRKKEREKCIKMYFENIRQMFDGTDLSKHIHSDNFAVDNMDANDPSLKLLRETIIQLGDEQSCEIPLKWIQLEKALLERKRLKLVSITDVTAIDLQNELPLGDTEQVKQFLQYHHCKGTFIYFDEEPISEYVIIDPQYLIDAFKCIITSERFCTNDPEIRPFWNLLLFEGTLEQKLIDYQWGKPENKTKMYKENKAILLSFLVKHHIISEAVVFDENTKQSTGLGWFVVPSLLRDHSSRTEIKKFLDGKKWTKLRYVLLFEFSPIVPTIYHRLVSAVVGNCPIARAGKKTLIFKDMCIVRLGYDHAGIVEMKHKSIEMAVVSLCPTTDVIGEQADSFRRHSESVVAHAFQKLRRTEETNNKQYTIRFRCNNDSHGVSGSENLIPMEDMRCGNVIPCPDFMSHDINVETAKEKWFQDNKKITAIPDIQLTDKLLSRLSQCIGENWQFLGLELGVTQVQIDHITEDHPRSAVMRIFIMLQTWCRKDADNATLKLLVETVQRCSRVNCDWDKLRNIIDKLNKDVNTKASTGTL